MALYTKTLIIEREHPQDWPFIGWDECAPGAKSCEASDVVDVWKPMTQEDALIFSSMAHGESRRVNGYRYFAEGPEQ